MTNLSEPQSEMSWMRTRSRCCRWPRVRRYPLRRFFLNTTSLGPRTLSTTTPETAAPSIVGPPTRTPPSPCTMSTRSKVTFSTFLPLTGWISTSITSPRSTRYCLPPLSMIANIKLSRDPTDWADSAQKRKAKGTTGRGERSNRRGPRPPGPAAASLPLPEGQREVGARFRPRPDRDALRCLIGLFEGVTLQARGVARHLDPLVPHAQGVGARRHALEREAAVFAGDRVVGVGRHHQVAAHPGMARLAGERH